MKRERTPIRTTDKQGIDGIILTGKPAGYWMAQSEPFPRLWVGVVADGRRAVRKHGTFGEVLEWLHRKAGILRDARADRVIRDCSDTFRGVRVSSDAAVRIPERDMTRAKAYTGFAVKVDRGKRGVKTPSHDGMRHGRTMPDSPHTQERHDRDEEILRLSREGLLQKEIAGRLGVTERVVNGCVRRMRKNGVEVPNVRAARDAAKRREKAEAFRRMKDAEGLPVSEIARREGVSPQRIYQAMQIPDAGGTEAGG